MRQGSVIWNATQRIKKVISGRPGVITKIDFNKIRVYNEETEYSETVKYLGVIWDRSMSSKPQVEKGIQNVSHSL